MTTSVSARGVSDRCDIPWRKSIMGVAAASAICLCAFAVRKEGAIMRDDKPTLELTSPGIREGEVLKKFTCDGEDVSPELAWSAPPAGTKSFALLVIDPDAPSGDFVHWIIYDLPAEKRVLPAGAPKQGELPDGSRQGKNDFGKAGYGGPCPPGHSPHRYFFNLYALDAKLSLASGATRKQVESAMKGHVLARGELVGKFHR